ncbi:uncharacterized protein [Blastocystis hominis]|uniref:Uncharacterized protein n=3 Tax=Blastocystis hominis TaxID=12968 RepID=D8M491_BLAHO|nr:uncharacterized protein [Blastocystis hominis]CBK22880.2 unnamed protein product [Blastocystis hominis]|eukprot:XP_012896928.1 uncharacterized protein [Blastocystis hominis]
MIDLGKSLEIDIIEIESDLIGIIIVVSDMNTVVLELLESPLIAFLIVNEQRSFVDDLAFPRGCKFSS